MALKLVNPGVQPLGQFDGGSDLLSFKGGEVVTFKSDANGRPVATKNLGTDGYRPLMLTDDGTSSYGTLFGTVVGGTAGTANGAVLGPHTATGSGKLTLWDKPGMYAVTLDAVASDLAPSNGALTAGSSLYATTAGLLTANKVLSFEKSGGPGLVVGNFVSFETDGSLVTTPNRLVSATGSSSPTVAVFHFSPDSSRYV
jgi:hypothetical protein